MPITKTPCALPEMACSIAASSWARRVCRLYSRCASRRTGRRRKLILRATIGSCSHQRARRGLVNADGSGLRYFQFDKPGQATLATRWDLS